MHMAVRLTATALQHADYGINAVAPLIPRLGGDSAPGSVTVYDELADAWLALATLPGQEFSSDITYPCALVVSAPSRFDDGNPQYAPEGRFTEGTAGVVVQLCVRDRDTARASRTLMYLLRAARGTLMHFSDPAHAADRVDAVGGLTLLPPISVEQGRAAIKPKGDTVVSAGLVVTYPVLEAAPLP